MLEAMLGKGAVTALNHLLAGEPWARERLRAFAGRRARLHSGRVILDLLVGHDGYFRRPEAAGEESPAVSIELPADAAWRFLSDRQAVFAAAKLSGSADFAETLGFVFRNLRWDVEEDLSQWVGDIFARRLARHGATALGWPKEAGIRLAGNISEYFADESDLLVPEAEVSSFCAGVQAVRNDLECLEMRLSRLPPM